MGCVSQKCSGCIDERDYFASLSNLPLFTDTFFPASLKISWLIKLFCRSPSVTFELVSHIQLLWYRCKEFWRRQAFQEFCKIGSCEKSELVPSLREDLRFVLQPVSCLPCKLAGLQALAWERAAFLAQFVRGVGAEEDGS